MPAALSPARRALPALRRWHGKGAVPGHSPLLSPASAAGGGTAEPTDPRAARGRAEEAAVPAQRRGRSPRRARRIPGWFSEPPHPPHTADAPRCRVPRSCGRRARSHPGAVPRLRNGETGPEEQRQPVEEGGGELSPQSSRSTAPKSRPVLSCCWGRTRKDIFLPRSFHSA